MAKRIGTPGDDILTGTGKKDLLKGLGGIDLLSGLGGNDTLKGGGSVDFLYGGGGRDKLLGGAFNDYLEPGGGKDIVNGGGGDSDAVSYVGSKSGVKVKLGEDGAKTVGKKGDAKGDEIRNVEGIIGSDHGDKLVGNNLRNFLTGGDGNDRIEGRLGDDVCDGGGGSDRILGQGGNDMLRGRDGDDRLYGGPGHDRLEGDDGDDELYGGSGFADMDNDDLFGGNGSDLFVFLAGFGHDVIHDFMPGEDAIRFGFVFEDFDDLLDNAEDIGPDVVIKSADSSLTLLNTSKAALMSGDFIFES